MSITRDGQGRPQLVLASKSPARKATLVSAGVSPLVRVSHVDEQAVIAQLLSDTDGAALPSQIVCAQAAAKAMQVASDVIQELTQGTFGSDETRIQAETTPGPILIVGCDSMLEISGKMVGKPHSPQVAQQRIQEMRGKEGILWTGHSLIPIRKIGAEWRADEPITRAASTVVYFGQISDEEIEEYVATKEPLNVAGSFTIDGLGGPFIEGVKGDPHSVVGISLPLLKKLTDAAGVFWPDLWEDQ